MTKRKRRGVENREEGEDPGGGYVYVLVWLVWLVWLVQPLFVTRMIFPDSLSRICWVDETTGS